MRSSYEFGDRGYPAPMEIFDEFEDDEEEITGTSDSRRPNRNTTKAPYRWICRLMITWPGGVNVGLSQNVGTGTLIGPKHVLTAAHNVHSRENGTAREVIVDPGRDRQLRPFGSARMSRFDAPGVWMSTFNSCFDYALITLDREIGNEQFNGKPLGYWGSEPNGDNTALGPGSLKASELNKKTVYMVGYPKDKCEYLDVRKFTRGSKCEYEQLAWGKPFGSRTMEERRYLEVKDCLSGNPWGKRATAQFGAKGKVVEAEARGARQLLLHDIDSCEGQSGAPVWMESGRTRYLIGVHTGPFGKQGSCPEPVRGGFSDRNRAILVSKDVRWNIIQWKVR